MIHQSSLPPDIGQFAGAPQKASPIRMAEYLATADSAAYWTEHVLEQWCARMLSNCDQGM